MVHLNVTINGQLIGTFNYSYNDLLNSPASLDDVIILAWGGTALVRGTERYEWGTTLKQFAQERPDESLKLIIDEVRVLSGREPATSQSPLIVDTVLQRYYVLTPKGSKLLVDGSIVNKIRHVSILPLEDSQVTLLENQGYDIEPEGSWDSIQDFVNGFPDPIALIGAPNTVINGQPVTIFPDGTTSSNNEGGVFEFPSVLTEQQINEIRNPTDVNGTEISIPIADNIVNNLGGSPNNGTPTGQEIIPPSDNSNVILPLGVLLLLSGGF